jgi:hypothetical protein
MDDGYHVASPECQGYLTLEVANWDGATHDIAGVPWQARTAGGTELSLPVEGVPIAAQSSAWVAEAPDGLSLEREGVVWVRASPRDEGDFDATTFDLNLEVGQYRDAQGNVGDWSSYIAGRTSC